MGSVPSVWIWNRLSSRSISGHLNGREEARRRLLLHAQLNNKRKTITPSHARFRFLRFLIRHRQFGNAAAHVESQSEISSVTTAGSGWGTEVSGAVGSLRLHGGRDQPAPPPHSFDRKPAAEGMMEPGRGRDTQSLPQGDAQMGGEGGGQHTHSPFRTRTSLKFRYLVPSLAC